ncbi:hypothetical protein [Herbidospora sp. RD11066]
MSFSIYVGLVRSGTVRHPLRVSALRCAVSRYRPLGFHATWDYLVSRAGRVNRDEAALLRALETLLTSRNAWLAEMADYAAHRKVAKRTRRVPPPGEYRRLTGFRWPGPDAHDATRYTVEALSARLREASYSDPRSAELHRRAMTCASAYLDGRPHDDLHACLADLDGVRLDYRTEEFGHFRRLGKMVELIVHDTP